MADVFTKAKRSDVMSRIRSRRNKDTEMVLVSILREFGIIGWRRNQVVFGNPDFVFRRERVVIFVDGCFWHGCPKCYRAPTSNESYWGAKYTRNRLRDQRVTKELRRLGWRVLRFWECVLSRRRHAKIAKQIQAVLESRSKALSAIK